MGKELRKRLLFLPMILLAALNIFALLNPYMVRVLAAEYPAIYVDPPSIIEPTLTPGKNFTISIKTDYTGDDVTAWQLILSYSASIIHGVDVTNGDLITTDKDPSAAFMPGTFDNTAGALSLTGAFFFYMPPAKPAVTSGPGTLANVTFTVVGTGDSAITVVGKAVESSKLIGWNSSRGEEYPIILAKTDLENIGHGYFKNECTPPTTTDNYDGLWHNEDFYINLTAIDDQSGVNETYYIINGGDEQNVSTHGQPYITTENANNTLEYWSIDNLDNEEFPHNFLTEIKLDKTPPIADAGPDQEVNKDTLVTLNASDSTDENNITSYTWTFTDEGTQTLTGVNPTYTFDTPGIYTITLNITDPPGNWDTDTITITVKETGAPIADAGPDQEVYEGSLVTFDGSGSTDDIGIVNYTWTFTDVTPQTLTGVDPTYTFTNPGIYIVTLNVTDADDNWDTDDVEITVLEFGIPIADAGPDQTVDEDTLVIFDGSNSTDDEDIVDYTWTFTDATLQTLTGVNPNYTFTNPGIYIVTLNVTDADDNWDTDDVKITVLEVTTPVVHDVAVTSVVPSPTVVSPGQSVTVTVVVENQGASPETFNVAAYYDTNEIGTQTVTLDPNNTTQLTFPWNTALITEGTYTISAKASTVSGETDLDDNTYIDETVTVVRQVGPSQALVIEFPGEREYIEDGDVKVRLVALVRYADTMAPASNANVTIRIYDPKGVLWVSSSMVENLTGTGIYEWESSDTIAELEMEKGFYLIHVQANFGGLEASEVSQFQIAPIEKMSSIISIDVDPNPASAGSNITLSGAINPKRVNVTVTILYRSEGGDWSKLRDVKISEEGYYSIGWQVTVARIYEVKASWPGDIRTEGAESEVKAVTVQGSGLIPAEILPHVIEVVAAMAGSIAGSIIGLLLSMRTREPKSAHKRTQ